MCIKLHPPDPGNLSNPSPPMPLTRPRAARIAREPVSPALEPSSADFLSLPTHYPIPAPRCLGESSQALIAATSPSPPPPVPSSRFLTSFYTRGLKLPQGPATFCAWYSPSPLHRPVTHCLSLWCPDPSHHTRPSLTQLVSCWPNPSLHLQFCLRDHFPMIPTSPSSKYLNFSTNQSPLPQP